ncbi:MAG: nitroreductase family protein [Syntrophaceae bacterium]|nr:nitroreductase family protein [Syntrophaceae bacterium]
MFKELSEKRRSVRIYADRPIETAKLDTIVEAVLRAPSGRGLRPWSLVVVTDKALLAKLSVAKPEGGAFVKDAAAAVVVCADQAASPIWLEDCSIAAVTIQYAAQDLGLGSRWAHIKGRDYGEGKTSTQYIAELLGLPENLAVLCIIALGYPGELPPPYKREELDFGKVSYNRYGQRQP